MPDLVHHEIAIRFERALVNLGTVRSRKKMNEAEFLLCEAELEKLKENLVQINREFREAQWNLTTIEVEWANAVGDDVNVDNFSPLGVVRNA